MIDAYLQRIGLLKSPPSTLDGLIELHQAHIFSVPFEDLDIHQSVPLNLDLEYLKAKVITRNRGGFCYELNSLFLSLLVALGFDVQMMSASVFTEEKTLGPKFDHLCLLVSIDRVRWLADVGFGDLFIHPVRIDTPETQKDLFHSFRVEKIDGSSFLLSMAIDNGPFENKYVFETQPVKIKDFEPQCLLKQSSPDSHFMKNKICTMATPEGRKTILNGKFIHKSNGDKKETLIENKTQESQILLDHFRIILNQ